ncbi:hypothetical protein [Steroidobacter cummioxidans]|uniref:hypothetical protein n=1 Tax=Steroidobacter cummioxidans TaxID=1803913 RepID=UPI000E30CF5F|nr:hypothetical protein [Steroidobacter cummioxidans]
MAALSFVGKKTDPAFLPALIALLLSIALPLQILVVGSPISHPDPERFAQLHLHDGFWWRAILTFAYFPAVLLLHLLAQPADRHFRTLFLAGFGLFLLGNGIDLLFRSVQFLVAHGIWAPQMLDTADVTGREAARSKILAFNEIAPAVGFCFSFLFAVGRGLMGAALLLERSKLRRLAGLALVTTGLLNLIIALTAVPMFSHLAAVGPFYLWIWPIGLILVAMAAWGQGVNKTRDESQ